MGKFPADKISEKEAEATWLDPIPEDDVSRILQQYPLPKDELVRILKAKKMTRDDLAQIVREWKDD
jgi:NACalpha-BTF3-like transcription factor